MNREIKFRAWDKNDKLWIAGWSIGQLGVSSDQGDKVFMQFTGLKDKNGKEIYEADLVKYQEYPTPLRVQWDYDQWGLFDGICNEASIDESVEVIGNIYENPELLKP